VDVLAKLDNKISQKALKKCFYEHSLQYGNTFLEIYKTAQYSYNSALVKTNCPSSKIKILRKTNYLDQK
jgi:hypothetical protein